MIMTSFETPAFNIRIYNYGYGLTEKQWNWREWIRDYKVSRQSLFRGAFECVGNPALVDAAENHSLHALIGIGLSGVH